MSRLAGPLSALGRLPSRRAAPGAVVLGYHDVVAATSDATGMTVSATQLDGHLRLLGRLGLRIVALSELVDRLESGRTVDRLASVTFDDALLGVHDHARPVLARHRVAATVFVVADHLGETPPWWPDANRTLTETELVELVADGHEIGSHTRSHRSLPSLAPTDLRDELETSRHRLRQLAGGPVDLLAYPSGHHDPNVRRAGQAAGYRAAFTFLNGRIVGTEDRWMLPRLTMGVHLTPSRLAYHLLRSARSWPDHQLDRVAGGRVW